MKRFLLFAMMCVCASIGAWAQSTYRFGTNNTGKVTISADGKSAVIHCDPDHSFNTAAEEVYAAMANVESVTFDASSVITGTDLTPLRDRMQNVKKLNLSGVKIGNTSNFYVGNFPALEELVMSGIESDGKPIEIAHNYALKKVVVTPVDDTNVTFNTNSSLKGIIKNENVTTTATFQWEGNYSTFSTIEPVNYTAPAAYVHGKTALKITGTMSEDEVANLDVLADASGEIRLLDMSEVTLSGTVSDYEFPFAGNKNLVSVILPKGLPDAKAEWFAGCTNLYSAITYDAGVTEIKAYINKPGSLRNTMMDFGNEDAYEQYGWQQTSSALGTQSLSEGNAATDLASTITKVKISGKFNNNDIGAYNAHYDENGHIAFDYDNVVYYNDLTAATGGAQGSGALHRTNGSNITTLDLTDAIPEIPTDLRLAAHAGNFKNLTTLRLPTDASVTEIPRDFLNASDLVNIKTLCIPANFEVIGARAFSALHQLRHVYTTGTDETVVYDNGAVTNAIVDSKGDLTETTFYGEDVVGKTVLYGTITLSSNVKMIESYAFSVQENIKDVYVLAQTAPECHVDAFSTVAYVANDAYDTGDVVKRGIITRSAYRNGMTKNDAGEITQPVKWMAMLHYPRECTTPDIQRYTDVTREYSVATGMRDGKGGIIYFPNQSEYYRAFLQGTFGYVWNAWDPARSTDGNNAVSSPALSKTKGHSQEGGQAAANQAYSGNSNTEVDKTDRAFYDVTLGDDNTSTLTKPEGLKNYWDTEWQGIQLYPKAAVFQSEYAYVADENGIYVKDATNGEFRSYNGAADDKLPRYSRVQAQAVDDDGNLEYDPCSEGNLVQDYSFVANNTDGEYVHDIEINPNQDRGQYVQNYEIYEDPDGDLYHPFALTSAPSDIWNGSYNPEDYYYPSGYDYRENAEKGTWRYYWSQWTERETFLTWGPTEQQIAEYDALTPSVKVITGYTKCTSRQDVNNHSSELYTVGTGYATWSSDVTDFIAGVNDTKYKKTYLEGYRKYDSSVDAADEPRYDVEDNGYRKYDAVLDADVTERFDKEYKEHVYRPFASTDEADEQRYCPRMEDAKIATTYNFANDYRGWHQFVLTAYAHNSKEEFVPYRSFITDCDWWTICEPFDLTKSEVNMLFGSGGLPYVSKLTHVIRDISNERITLMFSNNLMEYKETVAEGKVHGEISKTKGGVGDDDVVIHKGVPYLIRPNLSREDTRQFDIKKTELPDLYEKLMHEANMSGEEQKQIIYQGQYHVPAFVVNNDAKLENVESAEKTFTMGDGTKFNYSSGTIKYFGKNVAYDISSDFTYTFLGSFYKSVMPQYCYFLGWDKTLNGGKGGAAFWYNMVDDKTADEWNWNNGTGIIIPNWEKKSATERLIHSATESKDPARWIIHSLTGDDISKTQGAKKYSMDFGDNLPDDEEDGIVTGVNEVLSSETTRGHVYNLQGESVGDSLRGLSKGVYIVNGKKYVVK